MKTSVAKDAAIAVRLSQSRAGMTRGAGAHEAGRYLCVAVGLSDLPSAATELLQAAC